MGVHVHGCACVWVGELEGVSEQERERERERVFWVQRPRLGRRGSGKAVFFRKGKSQIIDVLRDSGAQRYTRVKDLFLGNFLGRPGHDIGDTVDH